MSTPSPGTNLPFDLTKRGLTQEERQRLLAAILAYEARLSGSRSFAAFVKQAWQFVMQVDPLVWGWHMDVLCMHFEEIARGGIRKLLVNVPPGHAKSVLMSVLWPAWIWTWWPKCQFLFASHSHDLSVRDSMRCRAVIESDWYRETYMRPGGWTLRADQNAKGHFINTLGGERYSTGIGGTGRRSHIIGIDDPIEAVNANSKAVRQAANDWIGQTLSVRFVDAQTGRIAMIMQRLHEDDPSGFVLAGGGWEHLMLASEFDPHRRSVTYHEVERRNGHVEILREPFWSDPRETPGELLFPQKFPLSVLEDLKRPNALGAIGYASQHDQNPRPVSGGMFEKQWWRFWKPDGIGSENAPRPRGCYEGPARALPKMFEKIILSVDANFKHAASADPVAIHVWGTYGPDRFLLQRVHGPLGFLLTVKAMRQLLPHVEQSYGRIFKTIIEAKANGDAIVETLQAQFERVIGVNPEGGKESRAAAHQPLVEAGNCYLPDGAPWLDAFTEEFAFFPKGRHDDDVDAWSQAMNELSLGPETTAEKFARMVP